MESLNDDWETFMNTNFDVEKLIEENVSSKNIKINTPKCSDIYISTKTMIAYLNQPIDINKVFWDVPILQYYDARNGVIKKQMKITTFNEEDTNQINLKLQGIEDYKQTVISHFENKKTKAEVKYKHVQKVSIGTSKKDLISYRSKEKGAFYNCFAIILRLNVGSEFKEIHIKIFNTGKMEIPGIQNNDLLIRALDYLVAYIQPYISSDSQPLSYNMDSIETVLINSNFNCGYYINREELFNKLKYHYKLITMYDPCSYPGIQSKFYYNFDKEEQDGVCHCNKKCNKKGSGTGVGQCREISFMIFRTGSVLIVGHCDEDMLRNIYKYIKNILEAEYSSINEGTIQHMEKKNVIKKVRKYTFIVDESNDEIVDSAD